jgi:transcriptional regulator with XRE-family HTH domain
MEALGDILRSAREERGISLEEAARRTKLRKDVLEALEEDAPQRLSSPSYATIFQKSYARFLGVDLGAGKHRSTRTEPEAAGSVAGVDHEAVRRLPALPSLPLSGAGVAAVILAAFLVVLLIVTTKERSRTPGPVPPSHDVRPSMAGASDAVPATSLVVRASADVAVRVERDGREVWSGVLTAGDRRTFDAASPVKLSFSRSEAVAVFAGGRRIDLPAGNAAEIVWPPGGSAAP